MAVDEARDSAAVEASAKHFFDILNYAAQGLLIGVGHKTGLIAAMRDLPPATSKEIAQAAATDERYTREWLGGMVVSGIVVYDPDAAT